MSAYVYVDAQKNESPFYENFPFGPFPRFPCCGKKIYTALSVQSFIFLFFYGH